MRRAAWPKISPRGGVEGESERTRMAVEKKWSCKKVFFFRLVWESEPRRAQNIFKN